MDHFQLHREQAPGQRHDENEKKNQQRQTTREKITTTTPIDWKSEMWKRQSRTKAPIYEKHSGFKHGCLHACSFDLVLY